MKKKLLGVMTVVAVAAVAGYNTYTSQSNAKLSDLALSNVEALAYGESGNSNCHMNDMWICNPWNSGSYCYCYM